MTTLDSFLEVTAIFTPEWNCTQLQLLRLVPSIFMQTSLGLWKSIAQSLVERRRLDENGKASVVRPEIQ